MHTINIKKEDIQGQTKLVFDTYNNSLEDILDRNIDDRILYKNNLL